MKFMTVKEINIQLILLVKNERKLTQEILKHINLFEKCAGHLHLGYSSMHQYLTRQLGYSDDQAFRRLKAARLFNQVPEVADKLQSGALNLTQAAQAQRAFEISERETGVAVTVETKTEILNSIEKANSFETKNLLANQLNLSPEIDEKIKPQALDTIRLETTLTRAQFDKLQTIKSLLSHKLPSQQTGEVLEVLFDFFLEKKQAHKRTVVNIPEGSPLKFAESSPLETAANSQAVTGSTHSLMKTRRQCSKRSRYIPKSVKGALYERSQGQCEFVSENGVRCLSRYKLQVDHKKPFSLGGGNNLENLRLACFSHNLHLATQSAIGIETTSLVRNSTHH
jgi:5-methylcytosine-specific restriction endonuclease McrA